MRTVARLSHNGSIFPKLGGSIIQVFWATAGTRGRLVLKRGVPLL